MLDSVRNNKILVQGFLLLIILTMAVWGIGSYVGSMGGGDSVATVGDSKITPQQFERALREQGERMRKVMGAEFKPDTMSRPEVRLGVLENLINERLLLLHAQKNHIGINDQQLAGLIASIPQLQEGGKFSIHLFEQAAAAQGLSKQGLEGLIRQKLVLSTEVLPVTAAAIVPHGSGNAWLAAALEDRDISEMAFKPEAYLGKVTLAADAAQKFYDDNKGRFEVPEQVRYEYLVLSQKVFEDMTQVSDAEIKAWYESHQSEYKDPEERRASHILIKADKDAKPEVIKAAEAKAKDILAQVKKNPSAAEFAKLAKKYSEDVGSAPAGGDVGEVSRGSMVKPFEDAVFALKQGQVSDLVRTDYGFHIIRLTALKPEHMKPLAEVKSEIIAAVKAQTAAKKYAEAAENFNNTVYEQADSLKPAADQFGLQVQQGSWLARGRPTAGLNEKISAALFSDDAVKNHRNTAAVEIAPNTLMAARVVEYKPAAVLPLAQVKTQIEAKLKRDEAAKLAAADAEAHLSKLKAGEDSAASWSNSRSITRAGAQGITGPALHAVFAAKTDKLPAYASVASLDGSTTLYRIAAVKPYVVGAKDDAKADALRKQYEQLAADAEFSAWMESLREQYKVKINQQTLLVKSADE